MDINSEGGEIEGQVSMEWE